MRDGSPTPHRRTRALYLVLAIVLLAGCSDDGSSADPTTTSESSTTTEATTTTAVPDTTTTSEPATDEEQILAAVDGFWQVLLDSSAPPDPEHPDLERYMTGAQLERSQAVVENRLRLGQAVRPAEPSRYAHENELVTVDGANATVTSCEIDDLVLYDLASGMVLNDATYTREWTLRLEMAAGSWKIADATVDLELEGVTGCAA